MEMEQGTVQGQDAPGTSALTESLDANRDSTTSQSPQSSSERVFRQSEVNDIVKKVKHNAVEDYKRLVTQQPDYAREKYGNEQYSQPQYSQPHNQSFTEDNVRKLASEEAQRLRDQWVQEAQSRYETDQAKKIVETFWEKVNAGREKYQDFDQITGNIEYSRFPNTVQLLSSNIDNVSDVLYELGKDRLKMLQIEQLAMISPSDAIVAAQRLSQSLKDNEEAGNIRVPRAPLSQLRPSNTGTDNGVMSVKDYRQKYRV